MKIKFNFSKLLIKNHLVGIIVALIIICVFFSLTSQFFLTTNNILNILLQVSIIAIVAFGMTFVLMIGEIDLSVGSIIALSGMIFAQLMAMTHNVVIALVGAVLVGGLAGLINGVLSTLFSIPSFIVTVATMGIFRGISFALTDSKPIRISDVQGLAIANEYFLGIPIPVYIMFFVLLIGHVVLSKMKLGRQAKMIGGNVEAARYAGVKILKITIIVFIIIGIFSALSGTILASRLYSAQPNSARGYELDAIAAAVLGGTSLTGGYGTVLGTFLGALIIGVVNNGMNLLGLSYFYQLIIKGCIILIAVYIDVNNKKRMLGQHKV